MKTPVNTNTDDGHRLEEFTDRSHRTEGDHRNYSCRRKKMWSTHSCLVQGDQTRTEWKYSTRTRAVTRKMEQEDNPACGDYSRKYLEIVARHKQTPWKSETDRVGWNSKDARSTKGNAYMQPQTYVKPPKFDGKGCIEFHLMQLKIAASQEKLDFLIISLTGGASSVLKDLDG